MLDQKTYELGRNEREASARNEINGHTTKTRYREASNGDPEDNRNASTAPVGSTILVKVVGANESMWYFNAIQGSFERCYEGDFIDKSLRCSYLEEDEDASLADVVVFRGARLETPLAQRYLQTPSRPPNQRWIFLENEPPPRVLSKVNLTRYNAVFNLTSTFSLEADIYRADMRRHRRCTLDADRYETLKDVDYTHKKRNGTVVAWFVSRCKSQSKRERYVRLLRKHIDVDIYGGCGTMSCGNRFDSDENCHEKLLHGDNSYKFYLSFENSLCTDYVTEKLWALERLDVVPVVLGLADYSKMIPNDTFINVKDFPSPKELAEYLHKLDRDPEMYNQYIRNRNSLKCSLMHEYKPWECILCERMHAMAGKTSVVNDLNKAWGLEQCMSPVNFMPSLYIGTSKLNANGTIAQLSTK
jgi:hypothetical protein